MEYINEEMNDKPICKSNTVEDESQTIHKSKNSFCKWRVGNNNTYIPTDEIITINKLIPSRYKINYDDNYRSIVFIKTDINSDELLNLPSPIFNSILNDVDFFWENNDKFIKYKYVHKRGILLYGIAGCGKSSICTLLANQVIEKGGVVFTINNSIDLEYYESAISKIFRFIEPNTKILTIIEDLDGLVKNSQSETQLLNLLDGNNQLNNVVYVGCTNYPEQLKDRILNRPSRFDRRYNIDKPTAEMREFYFRHKLANDDFTDESIKSLVTKTEGLTLAHLGELIKSVYIFGLEIDETVSILKGMSEFISSKSNIALNKKTGF